MNDPQLYVVESKSIKIITRLLWSCLIFSMVTLPSNTTAQEGLSEPLKLMSFNIRYGSANDGANRWDNRNELVIETIRTFDPDLLGTQEVLGFQADFLKDRLEGYGFHGVGRDDGASKGEFAPVMYKLNRFDLVDSGHFWLSENPDEPGSKSWDAALPRLVSWVVLQDKKNNYKEFVFANTHWDHVGKVARLESAKLMRERAEEVLYEGLPVIVCGDFNTTEEGEPYKALVLGEGFNGKPLVDSYRVIHPEPQNDEATFGGWVGRRSGRRIDWILHSGDIRTLNSAINYSRDGDRYPSDHYPVEAALRFNK